MLNSGDMQFNTLNYDRERGVVQFSLRKNLLDGAIVISGEVPLAILSSTDTRSSAKAAVRQALLDAADAMGDDEAEEE